MQNQDISIERIVAAAIGERPTTKERLCWEAERLGHFAPEQAVEDVLKNYLREGRAVFTDGRYVMIDICQ